MPVHMSLHHVHTYVYASVCSHAYAYIYLSVYAHAYAHVYASAYAHIYTHVVICVVTHVSTADVGVEQKQGLVYIVMAYGRRWCRARRRAGLSRGTWPITF